MIFKIIFLLVALPSYYNQGSDTQDRNKSDKNVLQNFIFTNVYFWLRDFYVTLSLRS